MLKVLTYMLNPLDEQDDLFLKNAKQLKDELEMLEINKSCIIGLQYIKDINIDEWIAKRDKTLKEWTKWFAKQMIDQGFA